MRAATPEGGGERPEDEDEDQRGARLISPTAFVSFFRRVYAQRRAPLERMWCGRIEKSHSILFHSCITCHCIALALHCIIIIIIIPSHDMTLHYITLHYMT